jgi:hypothetical protein
VRIRPWRTRIRACTPRTGIFRPRILTCKARILRTLKRTRNFRTRIGGSHACNINMIVRFRA